MFRAPGICTTGGFIRRCSLCFVIPISSPTLPGRTYAENTCTEPNFSPYTCISRAQTLIPSVVLGWFSRIRTTRRRKKKTQAHQIEKVLAAHSPATRKKWSRVSSAKNFLRMVGTGSLSLRHLFSPSSRL